MVNSIENATSTNALLRAQSVGVSTPKSSQPTTQTVIDQFQRTPSAALSAKGTTALAKANNAARNLPRGSLVDVLT